jgi:hypothetical protein
MVTWGQNQVHTFGSPAPAPATSFGTPAPAAPGGLFGSTQAPAPSAGLFGSPAPAAAGGGASLFGAPAPAAGGGLFGAPSPAPAPGGSLFGATPAAAPSTGMYGAPAASTSLFGAPAPSAYGANYSFLGSSSAGTPQQQQQQHIPAQAALQAHMDASARQEAERVRSALERLHAAYAGTAVPSSSGDESKFVAIVYNDLTPEQRQLQWLHGMGNGGQILAPDRPHQVSEEEWKKAVVNNPDHQNYMPVALVGAVALQARVSWQQDRANELASNAGTLHRSHETIRDRSARAKQDVEEKARRHVALRKRLLDVMRRVELARCMNQQIQPDEFKAVQRLTALLKEVDSVRGVLISLQDKARTQTAAAARSVPASGIPEKAQLLPVLKEQRQKLEKLTVTAQRDDRDVTLIQKRVGYSVPSMGSN